MLDDCYAEPILEPDLAIIDAHHHLWLVTEPVLAATAARDSIVAKAVSATFRKHRRYLHDELLSDMRSGHNIRATVFNDARAMYRASGPEELKSVGEVEFVNGIAAMFASGVFGAPRACAGIVGGADLRVSPLKVIKRCVQP